MNRSTRSIGRRAFRPLPRYSGGGTGWLLRKALPSAAALLAISLIALALRGCTHANKDADSSTAVTQRTFATPEEALQALVDAMRTHDVQQLEAIFGPDADDLLFSGDDVDDHLTFDRFLKAYDEKHQLSPGADNRTINIVVGNDEWPMPIPLVHDESDKAWVFDTASGMDEVITRRIGRNELTVIQVCKAICDAQRDYAQLDPNHDSIPEYARKFFSDPGKTDGLYWPTKEGEPLSPLGELVAKAQAEGYSTPETPSVYPSPYHGYLYRIITAQGSYAPGGAGSYIVDGKFIGGFAVVAWPADYGSSGIMTFIADYTGDVYQKDLGDDTDKLARAITEYNPDPTWKRAE
jgi:hypothetical protein